MQLVILHRLAVRFHADPASGGLGGLGTKREASARDQTVTLVPLAKTSAVTQRFPRLPDWLDSVGPAI
jgi:hypothetical protein